MNFPFKACLEPINPQHGPVPAEFLNELVSVIAELPDEMFEVNDRADIYWHLHPVFSPYADLTYRRAVMCEALRVDGGFESDWNWEEGVDNTNHTSLTHLVGQETGLWQVSADSLIFDPSLPACLDRVVGAHDVETFIKSMKTNHALAIEYVVRLLRFNTSWSGPINRNEVLWNVRRECVSEFISCLCA
jgi:hypothetical protein